MTSVYQRLLLNQKSDHKPNVAVTVTVYKIQQRQLSMRMGFTNQTMFLWQYFSEHSSENESSIVDDKLISCSQNMAGV